MINLVCLLYCAQYYTLWLNFMTGRNVKSCICPSQEITPPSRALLSHSCPCRRAFPSVTSQTKASVRRRVGAAFTLTLKAADARDARPRPPPPLDDVRTFSRTAFVCEKESLSSLSWPRSFPRWAVARSFLAC